MVVVVVRDGDQVDRRHRAKRDRHGLEALRSGEARGRSALAPHRIGDEVARNPLAAGRRQVSRGLTDGNGRSGTRRSPPQRNSLIVGIGTPGSRRPGRIGCTLRKRSPAQRGEAFIRSSRAPSGVPPNDFIALATRP